MSKLSTRDKIIIAAVKMFSRKGFSGTSTSEIAKEAGCAEGTIFRYFPRKIDLLKHVAQEFIKQFASGIATKTLHEILERSDDMSAEELMEEVMRDRLKLVEENYEILKIVFYEINFHVEVRELFLSEFRTNFLGVGVELAKVLGEKLGEENLDEYLILRTMMGQIMGILFQMQLFNTFENGEAVEPTNEMLKSSSRVAINGLRGMAS